MSLTPADSPLRGRRSGVITPHRAAWRQRFLGRLIFVSARTMEASLRFRLEDESGFFTNVPDERVVFATWHNRLALALSIHNRYVRRRDTSRRLAAMVSASRDGGMLARILELFEIQPVRGSTSRRGPQALRELTGWAERGHDLAITPDGPRGPAYKVQEGVISLAQLTGFPIVPVTLNLNWKLKLPSWDRFQMPLPFGRCEVRTGPLLRVPREATEVERETLRQQLEQTLLRITID
jgi:lysophospholipid acyltransferase (LPLAT)-like uncharacterized protein